MTEQERTEMTELKDARIAYLERQVVERDATIAQLQHQLARAEDQDA